VYADRDAFALGEGGRDRLAHAARRAGPAGEPIDDHEQVGLGREVGGLGQLLEVERRAGGEDADEAERAQVLDDRGVAQSGGRRQREGDHEPAGRFGEELGGRALRRVAADRRSADPAPAAAHARPEEAEEVVHFRGGPDGRAARHRGRLLLDGDRRREPFEAVHERLRHAIEELLGVGGQRLDVAPLSFGVDRVECERALPRAGWTGHDDEGAVRQVDGDALQVVLAGVDDADDGHARRILTPRASGKLRSGRRKRPPGATFRHSWPSSSRRKCCSAASRYSRSRR
jgi:hypothetical protein